MRSNAPKAERLFRAAVSAFCSLTRPSRREVAQLEDLALPLFDLVSVDSLRYVAAALSECEYPPEHLVRRLCGETVDIAAPLLIRSKVLTDIDLITLIGRKGAPHARAIGRRPNLHPTIAELVAALAKSAPQSVIAKPETAPVTTALVAPAELDSAISEKTSALEDARRRLRAMMQSANAAEANAFNPFFSTTAYAKLRDTALTGNPVFFQTALADTLSLDFATAGRILSDTSYTSLLGVLRAIEVTGDQAFVIAAALYPKQFAHAESIRLFLSRFKLLHRDAAIEKLRAWKAETIAATVAQAEPPKPTIAHNDALPPARSRVDLRIMSSR